MREIPVVNIMLGPEPEECPYCKDGQVLPRELSGAMAEMHQFLEYVITPKEGEDPQDVKFVQFGELVRQFWKAIDQLAAWKYENHRALVLRDLKIEALEKALTEVAVKYEKLQEGKDGDAETEVPTGEQ